MEIEWISVKDKLPETDGTYLVNVHEELENDDVFKCGDLVTEAWYSPNGLLFVPKSVGWHMLNEFYEHSDRMRDEITHWMPIPRSPFEEDIE